ncbi:GntR family transcriptional regulator [Cryobacterium tagatosivorans]|uniref:GntR family transcriptional regulator n=1 Tax=Cryobacterium tagatosivorans TaxID=1259199 RepID=A0A4R8UEE2_9MICO|nr:GntR family transcriptional regulator [Cryobacterium tagatosivorans]TFB51956.1 GntR family transcriptional regulator [Cryobacterium tagatosivorans]
MSVYTDIRAMVLAGDFDEDSRVSESSLAARLSVSRTPVREALQRLDADGLVHSQGRGIRVRVHRDAELAAVFEARAALDGYAAATIATRNGLGEIAPARIDELLTLADTAHGQTMTGDLTLATGQNRAFHQGIAALVGNPVIVQTLDRFWDQILVSTRRGLDEQSRAEAVDAEHRRVLDAIRRGDSAAAYAAAAEHAMTTRDITTEGNKK